MLLGRLRDAEQELARGQALDAAAVIWPAGLARIRLAEKRPDAAVALLAPAAATAPPMIRLTYVRALRGATDARTALAEAERQAQRDPGFCEGRAVLAALRMEAGQRADAREAASEIARTAGEAGASAALARCAALAAAGTGDADAAAAWLLRIAENDEALRLWVLPIDGVSGLSALRLGWYPWNLVVESPAVRAAAARLDQAYGRIRSDAAQALAGLLPDPSQD
jgi:predicted Zn-dependent protease